jgi:RHS repeat-associated protein
VWNGSDLNRDDVFPDSADDTFFNAQYTAAGSASPSGYDRQSAYGLRKGYAGYEWDDTLAMWHVRHRVLDSKSGKWTKRDPLGYVDGMNLTAYAKSSVVRKTDAMGLCVGCGGGAVTLELGDPSQYLPLIPESPEPRHRCQGTLDQALSDPRVSAALSAASAACPSSSLPSISISDCSGESGAFSCNVGGTSQISLCAEAGCPSVNSLVKIIIHELTHYKQYCGSRTGGVGGDDAEGNCTWFNLQNIFGHRTGREIEAYCSEPGTVCPPPNKLMTEVLCRDVSDGSGGDYCECMKHFGYNKEPECRPRPPVVYPPTGSIVDDKADL